MDPWSGMNIAYFREVAIQEAVCFNTSCIFLLLFTGNVGIGLLSDFLHVRAIPTFGSLMLSVPMVSDVCLVLSSKG